MKIPELKRYNGCKGGNGVYQQIISVIPPHKILIIPFLGHCGIVRNIKPCETLIAFDIDSKVTDAWKKYLIQDLLYNFDGSKTKLVKTSLSKGMLPRTIHIINGDSIHFLFELYEGKNELNINITETVVYLDPPYPLNAVKSTKKLYKNVLADYRHETLLNLLNLMPKLRSVISTYENDLYTEKLQDWNRLDFSAGTHNGKAIETLYYNYSLENGKLHDYRYLGKDYKDRERIKLKIERWANRLRLLEPREREAILQKLIPLGTNLKNKDNCS